jgi:hypothetical protein
VSWHPYVVDSLGELICRPFLFTILASEREVGYFYGVVVIERWSFFRRYRIAAIDPYYSVIVQDREEEGFPVKLLFILHNSVEFNNLRYR